MLGKGYNSPVVGVAFHIWAYCGNRNHGKKMLEGSTKGLAFLNYGLDFFFFLREVMCNLSYAGLLLPLKPDKFPAQAKTWDQECRLGVEDREAGQWPLLLKESKTGGQAGVKVRLFLACHF